MRLHRFYTPEKVEPQVVGSTALYRGSNQWRKVFRFKSGDQVVLFDGSGFDFICEITGYDDESAQVKVLEILPNTVVPKRETYLCAALVKKDTFEWIAQKATELGVSRIIPIVAERSEKKDINVERLNKIIIEAAEQSGRATLPELSEPMKLSEVLAQFGDRNKSGKSVKSEKSVRSIVWEPQAAAFDPQKISQDQLSEKTIVTYIGPEGGWSPTELVLFKEKGVAMFSMGPQILRAETAVVAALSIVTFL